MNETLDQDTQLFLQCRTHITAAAAEVARMYARWVEREDIEQVMWVWVLEHRDSIAALAEKGWALRRRVKDAGVDYARREKAAKTGYHPEDEYTYSLPVLMRLLPDAFDKAATRPTTGPSEGGAGTPAYNEWETQLVDVRCGLERLRYADYTVLKQVAAGSRAENDMLAQDALRALQRKVNRPPSG